MIAQPRYADRLEIAYYLYREIEFITLWNILSVIVSFCFVQFSAQYDSYNYHKTMIKQKVTFCARCDVRHVARRQRRVG